MQRPYRIKNDEAGPYFISGGKKVRVKSNAPKKLKGRIMRQSGPREQRKYKKGEAIKQKISQVINLGQQGQLSQAAAYDQYNPQYNEHRRRISEIETNAALQRASYEEKLNAIKREEALKSARAKVELDKIKLEAARESAKIRGDADIDTADVSRILGDIAIEAAEAKSGVKKRREETEATFTGLMRSIFADLTSAKKEEEAAKASGDADRAEKAEARVEALNADMAKVRESYTKRMSDLASEYESSIYKEKERADSAFTKLNAAEAREAFNLEREYDTEELLRKRVDYIRLRNSRKQQIKMITEDIDKLSESRRPKDIAERNSLIERSNELKDQLGYINNEIDKLGKEIERKDAEDRGRIPGSLFEPLQPESKAGIALKLFEESQDEERKIMDQMRADQERIKKSLEAQQLLKKQQEEAAAIAAAAKAKGEEALAAAAQVGFSEPSQEQIDAARAKSFELQEAAKKLREGSATGEDLPPAPVPIVPKKMSIVEAGELKKEFDNAVKTGTPIPPEKLEKYKEAADRLGKYMPFAQNVRKYEREQIEKFQSSVGNIEEEPPKAQPKLEPKIKSPESEFMKYPKEEPTESAAEESPIETIYTAPPPSKKLTPDDLKKLAEISEGTTPLPEKPIDYSSESSIEGMGNGQGEPTSDQDLSALAKRVGAPKSFLGVYTADELVKIPAAEIKSQHRKYGDVSMIVNTKPNSFFSRGGSSDAVGHWCAIMIDGDSAMYYDPFGDGASKEILRGINHIVEAIDPEVMLKLKENGVVNQDASTNNCGFFALKFLSDMWAGEDFKEATGFKEIKQDISGEGEREVEEFKKIILSPREFNKFI